MLVGCKFNKNRVAALCDSIEDCNDEEAKLIAEKIDNLNQYASNFVTVGSILTQGGVDTRTPLYSACKSNNLEMIRYLLEQGADPNLYISVPPVFHLVSNLINLHRDDKYQKTDYIKE